jgi:fatty acid kinase
MTRRSCDGAGLLAAFRAAVENLEAHVDEVNALNVYPVPDGDTGSNMLATVRAALDEAQGVDGGPTERIAAAISFGALMGARGNSGVIASQVFRGMAEALGGKRRFNGLDLAFALGEGTRAAYGAVAHPVEGTILTVIREAAEAAVAAAEQSPDIEAVLAATVAAADASVARTPSLLPILREAGVVDAGGRGLFRLFEGALLHVRGTARAAAAAAPGPSPSALSTPSVLVAHADDGFGYETMFLVQAAPGAALDVDAIRVHLASIGVSVLVAGDARALKVHVHCERPDAVLAYGLSLGTLTRISVENLDAQVRDAPAERPVGGVATVPTERAPVPTGRAAVAGGRAAVAARPDAAAETSVPGSNGHAPAGLNGTARNGASHGPMALDEFDTVGSALAVRELAPAEAPLRTGPAVVAVAAGDGLARIFEEFGVDQVVRGGQAENPSTGELLRVARLARAQEVLILPNNPNVRLAAEQAAALCSDRRLVVVPTRNAAEGLAALLEVDPTKDAAANAGPMTDAARALATLQVTEAVRDATISGRKVHKGQTIVLDPDDGLVASDADRDRAVLAGVATFPPGVELVTIYYGAGADLIEAESIGRRIGTARPAAEVEVVHGGQAHYRYLISAE